MLQVACLTLPEHREIVINLISTFPEPLKMLHSLWPVLLGFVSPIPMCQLVWGSYLSAMQIFRIVGRVYLSSTYP